MNCLPTNCRDCPVWQKSLFKELDSGLLDWIAERKTLMNLKKRETVFRQGQEVKGMYCHLQGLAKVVQTNEQGKVRFSRFVLPGDTSGHRSLFIETNYKGTTEVVSSSLDVCYLPKDDILYLLSNSPSFARNLVAKISTELLRSEEEHISAREQTVRGRLAKLLYELYEAHSEPLGESKSVIQWEITKKDIADILSVANETVIRLMSDMKSEGIIAYEGKKIAICNLEQLAKLKA